MKNITLLALDTSTEACSVALWHKGEKTHLDELAQRTHTKRILPMVDELLANSGINLKQVDALAFDVVLVVLLVSVSVQGLLKGLHWVLIYLLLRYQI